MRKLTVLFCLVAMVATGCAEPMARSFGSDVLKAPDGSGRWTRGSIVQADGSQVVRSADEKCDAVKDAAGKTVGWTNCNPLANATTAIGDDSPGAKTGKIMGGVAESAIRATGEVLAAEQIKKGMIGAAKARRPDTTTVDQDQTANPVQNANPTNNNTNTPKSCSGTGCTNN